MNRKLYLIVALLMLASLLTLASCNKGGESTDTTASDTTSAETEATTAIPRYDYMDAVVAPDVEIDRADYAGITLTVPDSLKIEVEDVEAYIQSSILFSRRAAVNGTTMVKDQALKLGDDAYIYYKGFVDGKEFEGGSNWDDANPYTLGLGSGAFIPGFEEGLVGVIPANATKDSPAEVHVTFPENYNPELAGKDAVFYVAVVYAVQYTLPEYNRATVENTLKYEGKKDFYASDAAYLSEFEGYVKTYLEGQIAEDLEYEKINALWNHLTEKAACVNLPKLELDWKSFTDMTEQDVTTEDLIVDTRIAKAYINIKNKKRNKTPEYIGNQLFLPYILIRIQHNRHGNRLT